MNTPLSTDHQNQRTFYYLLGNTLATSITNFTVWFAITFFVYLQTRSVAATGIIAGIYAALTAMSGIWFGSLVDHHKKHSVMMASSLVSLVFYLCSFVVYLLADPSTFKDPWSPILWLFIMLLMLGTIAGNIRNIALSTCVTILVPEDRRDKANGLVGTASGVSFMVTSVISGILVGLAGMYYVLILALVVTLAAIAHLWFVRVPEKGVVHTQEGPKKIDLRGTYKVVLAIPGLMALILFTTFNNFLGGVFMALMDAYGLSLVSVEVWGLLWGFLSLGFIAGGLLIAKLGLGKNPLRTMFIANLIAWAVSAVFTLQSWIWLLVVGMFIWLCLTPYVEAAEQTILQKVVPLGRQGRVFGFAQSIEQAAMPITAFLMGPITQIFFIPLMSEGGAGAAAIGSWFGVGPERGIALVFTLTGIVGFIVTLLAFGSKYYRLLSNRYMTPTN